MFLLSSLAGETHPLLLFVLGRTTYAQVFGDGNLRINHFVFYLLLECGRVKTIQGGICKGAGYGSISS